MEPSQASATFQEAIKDAEHLLGHFDKLNTKPPPLENEVLKRAGLVMAMTAWETFVEDRVCEAAEVRLRTCSDAGIVAFVKSRLNDEIKRLHSPTADKTIQLFNDYAGIDVSSGWRWNHVDPKVAKDRLNGYIRLRGDVVHRSRVTPKGPTPAHPVTKDDLHKAIGFLKELVKGTERALSTLPLPTA